MERNKFDPVEWKNMYEVVLALIFALLAGVSLFYKKMMMGYTIAIIALAIAAFAYYQRESTTAALFYLIALTGCLYYLLRDYKNI